MHTCGFCKDPVPAQSGPRKAHLTIAKMEDDRIHTHGDLENKEVVQELLETAAVSVGLSSKIGGEAPKEVVFHNRQRIGDMLMFTCGVRDFKKAFPKTRVNVVSIAAHIFDHNPHIDRTLTPTDQNTVKIGPGKGTNQSNRVDWHFANAYRMSIEDALKIQIPQGLSRPDIWLTEEEYTAPRFFKDPYWLIVVSGEKGWNAKMYPFERWQEVVNQNPDLCFVQLGTKGDNPPRLQGQNVIDHVGKTEDKNTGVRDLYKLFLNAEGSIGLVSFHMHLSGALWKPCVVVAGAREPSSFTKYEGHQYLATDGTLPCAVQACWACDLNPPAPKKSRCTNQVMLNGQRVPRCVDMIDPAEITAAIRRYYTGGRLIKGQPSGPTIRKFCNIVPTPVQIQPEPPKPESTLDWGKGAIDPLDGPFIEEVIKKHQVKTVLEFGAGLSTLLMGRIAKVTSFETEDEWIEKVRSRISLECVDIFKWDGRNLPVPPPCALADFDLAFVDGPANGQNREEATRLAANHAKIVIMHDATREWEAKWEAKYLKPGFQGPIKGGRWCHLWIKTPSFVQHPSPPPKTMRSDAKKIKIVSTARGWGGCARSITTIMKKLLNEGHSVEFVPFRNSIGSREFKDALKNGLADVKVSESYDSIRESCDVLMVYADDFVWEFSKPEIRDVFEGVSANRRIMMINYRRGGIGEIPWTRGWDKYLFLNSGQEKDLLRVHPGVETGVLPPCTDLDRFFEMQPMYELPVRIVRHNSQGDVKFDKEKATSEIEAALNSRPDLQIHMMPGQSFVPAVPERFIKYPKNTPPVPKFLESGNLFWYSLPKGYMDMGPRVILEAMAAGLAVIADPWGGAADRVTPETGWLASKEEQIEIIKNVTAAELKTKGEAARARALKEFRAERWIEELTGELCTAPTP